MNDSDTDIHNKQLLPIETKSNFEIEDLDDDNNNNTGLNNLNSLNNNNTSTNNNKNTSFPDEMTIEKSTFQIENPSFLDKDNDSLFERLSLKSDKQNLNCNSNFKLFCLQTKLMVWKNFLLFKRNFKLTLFQMITPVFICVMLIFMQQLTKYYTENTERRNPDINTLENMTRCYKPNNCTTIGFGVVV